MVTGTHEPGSEAKIRPFTPADATTIAEIDGATRGKEARPAEVWHAYFQHSANNGGVALVLEFGDKLVGYLASPPVPGIPNCHILVGSMLPAYRGQGLSTMLLKETLQRLSGEKRRVLVRSELDEPDFISFLEKNGFQIQHRDLHLQLDSLENLPDVKIPPGMLRFPYQQDRDEAEFIRYHTLAFEQQPRFQQYTLADVKAEVDENFLDTDILLLQTEAGEPVGFVWSILRGETVQIEPLGVSPNWRGKGMGELLLYLGLEYGRKRGATQAELWTSEDNIVSLKLYRKAGFRVVGGFAIYYIDLK